jgi:hypothetical protein
MKSEPQGWLGFVHWRSRLAGYSLSIAIISIYFPGILDLCPLLRAAVFYFYLFKYDFFFILKPGFVKFPVDFLDSVTFHFHSWRR